MTTYQFDNIQDPIARAEAMRAQAVAQLTIGAIEGLASLVKGAYSRVSAHVQYRRNYNTLMAMTDRELDDIGITRGDVAMVARGFDPRVRRELAGDALTQRAALSEVFGSEAAAKTPANQDHQRPAVAA